MAAVTSPPLYPRLAATRLVEALADTPVVLIHGPRQSGKTTLAKIVGVDGGYSYLSFDDGVLVSAAAADPVGFVDDLPERVILDEVQRAPGLLTAIKTAVDRDRTPGRFILTGSVAYHVHPYLHSSWAAQHVARVPGGGTMSIRVDVVPIHIVVPIHPFR